MQISMLVIGTRGDAQSSIALGLGLRASGHHVHIATHRPYAKLVIDAGLAFSPISSMQEAVERVGGHQALGEKRHSILFQRRFFELLGPYLASAVGEGADACKGADVIIGKGLGIIAGYHIAEALKIPLVRICCYPVSPSTEYPAFFVPTQVRLRGPLNRWSHILRDQASWLLLRASQNQARRDLLALHPLPLRDPIAALDEQHGLLLYGYSPVIFPRPADWGEWCQVTGYWFLDRRPDWKPPTDLVDFIDSGPPPVFVGFGSMAGAGETRALVLEALARSGQRGVVQGEAPGAENSALSDDIYLVGDIPHDWLFERMSAVVHQGGAGTTHAGLRAGKPCVIVPHIPDQHFWAHRMHTLGVSPPALPRRGLSVEGLATAIRTVTTSTGMPKRAAAIGSRIKEEDGVARAVSIFDAYLGVGPTRHRYG